MNSKGGKVIKGVHASQESDNKQKYKQNAHKTALESTPRTKDIAWANNAVLLPDFSDLPPSCHVVIRIGFSLSDVPDHWVSTDPYVQL
jgi:hypothetical protein